jgi:hypothetical protein
MLNCNQDTETTPDALPEHGAQAEAIIDTEDFRFEGLMEDAFAGAYEPMETYEPNVYDGTYSEE